MKPKEIQTPHLKNISLASTSNSHKVHSKLFDFKSNLSNKALLLITTTMLLLVGAAFLFFKMQPYYEQLYFERISTSWGSALIYTSLVLLAIKLSFLGYLTALYIKYKAVPAVSDTALPTCTVIVPAYNEGKLVWETLHSLSQSNYPKEKLELIAIDDGSQDDTWDWILKAKDELGDCLSIYQQPKNKGKRHALYRGFHLGKGDIFITVDSDSVVKKDTLRNMTSPFVTDEKCGAVAGNVKVLNDKQAFIPKMLNVSFAFSFEFVRSAQSVLGSVLCTPGALAAYRRDAVMNCLPEWINQTFMGQKSNIGEDRAMTNMILKQGLHVKFQRNALVYTNIPENYTTLRKMFLRWERSNVRENIMMSKFAFRNFREEAKAGTRVLLLNQWLKILLSYPMVVLMFVFAFTNPVLFFASTLTGILMFSSVQAIFYAVKHKLNESFWAYPYSVFFTFTLFWITPYAIATAGKSGWLTRTIEETPSVKRQFIYTEEAKVA